MNGSSEALDAPLSAAEQAALSEKLLALLAEQIRRYTGGGSSSVPTDTAEALLRSLCYTLGLDGAAPPSRLRELAGAELDAELRRGQARLAEKKRRGERLWRVVCQTLPAGESRSLTDTVRSIGGFWRQWDLRYFAHAIPCDIDYQLSRPVPETLPGVDYINLYLERLAAENGFLARFAPERLGAVWRAESPIYRELLVNLFEPPASAALGLSLAGRPARGLDLTGADRARLRERLGRTPETAAAALAEAADSLAQELALAPVSARALRGYARRLAPRAALAAVRGGLEGVFLSPADGGA